MNFNAPENSQSSVVSRQLSLTRTAGLRPAALAIGRLGCLCFLLFLAPSLFAATLPIYYVDEPVESTNIPPVINATRVVIRNRFYVNTSSGTPQPYQTLNTLFYTNTPSGQVLGSPGFRYDFFTNNTRQAMNTWVNQNTNSGGTWMMVWATNIISSGAIMSGPAGLVRLQGRNLSLIRNGIRAGLEPGVSFGDGFTFISSSNYLNAPGITDLYWGAGTNNALNNQGTPMVLGFTNGNVFPGVLDVPCTLSPYHQVIDTRFLIGFNFTNLVTVPDTFFTFGSNCFKQFDAYVYTNTINPTSRVIQVAFVSRNLFDTNLTTRVRFVSDFADFGSARIDDGQTIMVELGAVERDSISGKFSTNTVYFIDRGAFTNAYLQRNFLSLTRKPSTYEIARATPFGFLDPGATSGNATFSPSLLYNPAYTSNAVTVGYAAYRVRLNSTGATNSSGTGILHPTNYPGRVEILGDTVNLDRARIKAESTCIIKAGNLVSNAVAQVDAPFCSYDLGTTTPPLIVTNLAPPYVQRLSGEIAAWSAIWDNTEETPSSTNRIRFHVLVLDNDLQSLQPVVITDLALRAAHVVISDMVNVRDSFFTTATALDITGSLSLPSNWRSNNVPNLLHFTNDGSLYIPGSARFGTDRPTGYANFINRGTNVASAQFIRTERFENSGCIIANNGLLSIDASTVNLQGGPATVTTNLFTNAIVIGNSTFTNIFSAVVTNITGKLQGNSDVQIVTHDLFASNSFIRAGAGSVGALLLTVDNSLTDGGIGTSNYWAASAGIELTRRPAAAGNLLGTALASLALNEQQEVFHTWPGQDRGNSASGFDNNLALLKLTLDGAPSTVFHFSPSAGQSSGAIYVDYLELLNNATNYDDPINPALNIAPGMTIYFANANIPPETRLDGAVGGKLVWVSSYAGPLSGTNIVYPSPPYPPGTVVRANIALAQSKEIDSDGDGIVNADDPDPFFISQSVGLTIGISKSGDALLSWKALARATNVLECANTLHSDSWNVVTNFVQGDQTTRVNVRQSLSQTNQCIYRVRVVPPR